MLLGYFCFFLSRRVGPSFLGQRFLVVENGPGPKPHGAPVSSRSGKIPVTTPLPNGARP